uniref:Lytic transglycosylase n=1 Tax=Pseudomonas phage RVTF4 TaxID=3236931 RepID=A0AB39CD92_9VIRU
MASNKTKLADANQKSAFDFDDDFESYFDDDFNTNKKKKPLQEFMAGFKDGLLDKNKNKSLLRAFLVNGAPKGYDRLFGAYDDLKRGATDLKDHLEKTNPGDLQYLFKRAESFLPSLKDKVSESTYDRLQSNIANKVDQYKYQIEANQDQKRVAIRRQQADDQKNMQEMLGEDLRSAVDQGTVVSQKLFNKGQQADDRRWNLDRIERGLRDQAQDKHNQYMSRGLAQAVDGITRMASYTEQVHYDFQRKGLELQFRSYIALRDMSKIAEATMDMQNKAFQALVRNTGLPDHLKSSMKDLLSMNMRQGIAQGGISMAGRSLSSFLGGYGSNVQNRVNQRASSTLSGIVQGLQTGESFSDFWDQRYNLAGGLAADAVHGGMRSYVAPMVGRMARPMMTRMSNKHGRGKHNQVGYMLDNMPAMMQEFVNNYQNSYGAKGVLQDMLRPFVPQFGLDTSTKSGSYQTIGQHTAFNQLTQRTITEILPGFQARILRELQRIRTGKEDIALTAFDITKGTWGTDKSAKDALQDRIVSKGTTRMVSGQISEALDKMDPENKLSKGARRALSERLMRDANTNKRFDPMRYGSKYGYKEGTSKETIAELESFFKEQFERDDKGKFADTAANHEKRKMYSDAFLDIRNVSRDPAAEIHRIIESGNTGMLREMGILETVEGQDRINYPMLWAMMSSQVSDTHAGDGYRYRESSGQVGDKNFVGPAFPGHASARAQNATIRFLEGPQAQRAKDAAKRGMGSAKDLMDQFRADPMQFMRDKYEAGLQGAKDKGGQLRDSAKAAADAAKAGGLPAVMEHFSAKEKLDMAKALLENTIEKEPPAMREARLKMAQALIASIDTAAEKGNQLLATETGQKAVAAGNQMLALGHDTAEQIRQSEAAGVVDLKLQEGKEVLIKATDMMQGKLIDVNTGKVIRRASDITGEVRNHLNQQVASASEVAQGLYSDRGKLMAQAREKLDSIQAVIKSTATNLAGQAKDKLDDMKDWCLEGKNEVIIKSRELLDGKYFDAESGEPIYSLDDIKGTLLDAQGRIIATGEELARGLRSMDGKKFDVPGMKEKASALAKQLWRGNTTSNILSMMGTAGSFMWKLARNTYARMTGDRDAYLPPNLKPILTVEKLKEGKYLNSKGEPYKSMGDINDSVIDADTGVALLDKGELKQLVDVNGKKHKIAKNRGLLRRMVKGAASGYWNLTKAYYRQLGKEFGMDAKAGAKTLLAPMGEFSKRQLANLSTTDQVLVQIRDAIRETVPKKNRKGSWMEKAEKKEQDAQNANGSDAKAEKERKGMFAGLTGAIGGLWDKLRGKKKDEEGDEDGEGGGILDTAQDALGTAADAKDLFGGRGGRRGRGAGRLGRMGSRIASSRVGQFVATQGGRMLATRGAMMVGTALAGLFSAPVLIGAAVVAGVGVAGYVGYKYYKSVNGELGNLRYLQYGVNGIRKRRKILALEKLLEKTAVRGQNAQLNLNADSGKEIMDIMGFSKDDEAEIHRFARWVDLRFKPVFIQWLRALDTVGQTQMSLADIDDKLDDKLKGTFLQEVQIEYGEGGPFSMRDNPFGDKEPLDDTIEETKEVFEKLKAKYKVDPEAEKKAGLPGVQPEASKDPDNVKRWEEGEAPANPAGTVVGAAATAAAKKAADEAKAVGKQGLEEKKKTAQDLSNKVNAIAKAAAVGSTAQFSNFVSNPVKLPNTTLPALDAIRMRAYGLETLDQAFVEALMTMEKSVHRQSKADQTGMIKFNGNMEYFVGACGSLLGMKTSENGPERVKFVNWMNQRFMPVCEAFLTSLRVTYRGQPDQASTQIQLGDQVRIANAIIGAQSPDSTAVWSTPSIFVIAGELQDLKRLADIDLDDLKKKAAAVLSSPTQSAGAQEAGKNAAAGGKSFLDGITDTLSGAAKATGSFISGAVDGVGSALSGAVSGIKSFFGGSSDTSSGSSYSGSQTGQDVAAVEGQQFGYIQAGNGGSWEQIPMPTAKTAKGSRATMEAVAKMVGVPVEYLMIFCAMESGFDWTIKAGAGGSATGWFQFINSTWDWMLQQHSKKYGIPPDVGRRLRLDPRINALMGAEYMKYSMQVIKKGCGKDPTDIDIYLAHFLGPGTAVKWLKMPKNTVGAYAFPREAAANPSIFKGGRTLGQIEQSFDKRMDQFRAMASAGTSTGAAVPLKTEDVEKATAEEAAKKAEAEAKKDDKFIPGVSAMPGGPSVTGSTPTNAGTGGATQPGVTGGGATTAPAGGQTAPVGVMAPTQSQTESPDAGASSTGGNAYQQAQAAAQAAAAAKDAERAKQVGQETQGAQSILSINQEMLSVQKAQLEALKALVQGQGLGGQGNSMPKASPTRGANNSPFPVTV